MTRRATRARTTGTPAHSSRRRPPLHGGGTRARAPRREMARTISAAKDGTPLDEAAIAGLFRARGDDLAAVIERSGRAAPGGCRRRREFRRQPQHQLHQHLHVSLRLLRVLQGPQRAEPAWPGVPPVARRDRRSNARSLGARSDRGLPAGRDPSVVHRRDVPRHRRRGEARRPADPRARILAARDHATGRTRSGCRSETFSGVSPRRGSRPCPARRPRSSTTRCAP